MLDNYFGSTAMSTVEQRKRLLAVQAALEIAKASASTATSFSGTDKVKYDLTCVEAIVSDLADAIQYALDPAEEE